ncbi:Multidrug resistance protein MdtL [Corynebacterium faecale]|uniref:MFS transporter n=1 Tax=Corynebacterium faecale TaxID=1758466 RepID=UPI0025B4A31F|nr:MFS transporter [Corynebacterium faecale]WJY92275.1 Multidrug resistance protein MdtL [Corynebacterium faecale]
MPTPVTEAANAEKTGEKKLFTPTFAMGWLINFSFFLVFYYLITVMALYAVREFAASDFAGGFASSSFVVGATIARLFSGFVVDRFGRRRILLIAAVLAVIASSLYLVADSLALLIGVRMLHGLAFSLASTSVMALTQSVIPPTRRAEGTGYLSLTTTLAAAVGPALALVLVDTYNYDVLFWVALATSVISLIASLFLRDPAGNSVNRSITWSLKTVVHPAVLPIAAFMMIIALCYAGVLTYINPYAEERGLITGAAFFFIAYAVTMLVTRPFLGRIQDRRGPNPVVAFGLFWLFIALLLLSVADTDWLVILAGACTGMGYGTLMPAAQAMSVDAVSPHQIGTALSTLFLLVDIGFGLGPLLLGVLLGWVGYGTLYLILSGGVVCAGIYYLIILLLKRRQARARVSGI